MSSTERGRRVVGITGRTRVRGPTPAEAIRQARRRIALESVDIAISALTDVARDKAAPPPARATAGSALLRAAGLFERSTDQDDKPIYEMSVDELQAKLAALEAEAEGDGDDPAFDDRNSIFD